MKKSLFWLVVVLIYAWTTLLVGSSTGQPFFIDAAARIKQLAKSQAILVDYYKTLAMNTNVKPDLINQRTETSKTYANADGTFTARIYQTPIHYKENYADASEFWKDIDQKHTVETATYVEYDRMPTVVKVFKNETGYEIDSRKSGKKYLVELQDINGQKVSKEESQKFASSLIGTANAAETSPVKFSFEVSTSGVRLWKTIQGENAPKTFTWKVTQTGVGNDLQFRDIPEAYQVINGQDRPDQQVKIQTQKEDIPNTKSFIWTEIASSSNLKIDTDVIYYPEGWLGSTTVDGYAYMTGSISPWSGPHDSTSGNVNPMTASGDFANVSSDASSNTWSNITRSIFTFNTAGLGAGVTVLGATLSLYGTAKSDTGSWSPAINVYSFSSSSMTMLVSADYNKSNFGATTSPFATAIPYASWSTSGYNVFTFNGTGIAGINKTGVTKLGTRESNYDANTDNGTAPTWSASKVSSFTGYFADNGSNKPALDVTYTGSPVSISTGNVLLTGTILPYLTFTLSGSTASFGNITPGSSTCANGASGTETDVTTNSSNGYTLAVSDSSDTNSAMLHADGATYIPDFTTGTIATPAVYGGYGVGINLFSGTQKEAKWGTGTTDCDTSFDKWAGVPSAATVAHTVTGYTVAADKSYWGWIVKVANTQKTGIYSGNVLMTVATVLN
jgi:hypothetical protein